MKIEHSRKLDMLMLNRFVTKIAIGKKTSRNKNRYSETPDKRSQYCQNLKKKGKPSTVIFLKYAVRSVCCCSVVL